MVSHYRVGGLGFASELRSNYLLHGTRQTAVGHRPIHAAFHPDPKNPPRGFNEEDADQCRHLDNYRLTAAAAPNLTVEGFRHSAPAKFATTTRQPPKHECEDPAADNTMSNGQDGHSHSPVASLKKGKQKKAVDSNESAKLLAQRISQLEQESAGEKDQEAEIEREVKRANRDLAQQVAKMSDLQKIEHLTRRSSELLADMRRVERENQKNKKRGDTLQKEKDANRTELSKTVGLKEKLEKLCRELQRDNNKYKNENKTLQDNLKHNGSAYDEKHAALLAKLEGIQEEKDHPRKQVVDMSVDTLFRNRFKSFIEQYELRELHFHSLMRTKELEVQYNMARYEREKKLAESEASRARNLQTQVQTFTKTETELRNQLNVYVDKFKQVEDTLNNSNDLFLTFRKEMEDMSKKTKRLEKENETMKRKHEATNANIIRMAEEREDWRKKAAEATKKADKLRSIIEQMQQQGRKVPPGMAATLESCYSDSNGHLDGDGSDYSDEDEGDEDASDFDDDTEEEPQPSEPSPPRPFGPERPPVPQAATNGH
ncbi:Alpha-taxilin [Colletotrichum orbiculare MAFF 240422]|uniref:Alpha-taxilin n=2 Tax=Colletotrichum orbiculare species complex TaxID=2707354 RepID=A0A484FNX6_COLOR|nr:Alpha-taxilin [Colletotrichum orbiculare MAFF 240422]